MYIEQLLHMPACGINDTTIHHCKTCGGLGNCISVLQKLPSLFPSRQEVRISFKLYFGFCESARDHVKPDAFLQTAHLSERWRCTEPTLRGGLARGRRCQTWKLSTQWRLSQLPRPWSSQSNCAASAPTRSSLWRRTLTQRGPLRSALARCAAISASQAPHRSQSICARGVCLGAGFVLFSKYDLPVDLACLLLVCIAVSLQPTACVHAYHFMI